jgi:CheY-like chemotaxis protein/two-component sensor histidine kinase
VFRDGKPAGTRSFLRDVSEEQLLQERLAQAQKMESVGRLAGGVAHDFNNIMQVILGHSDFALARVDDDSETRNHLREIRAAANRAAALTSRLLAFSRQEVIHARTLDLNELTSETLNMLRRIIPENIEISFSPSPDGLRVDADQGQLEQVIMNLLINARDSMPRGGRLTVSTASEVDSEGDRLARLVVSDTGCGMDEATRQKVFEPFFSTKERGRGTGLGLSIVFGIVHQHGGAIDVESNIGVGTTFTVTLPVALAVQPEESGIADEQPEGGMETILLAEDEPAVREVISGCLEGAGYVVFTASDGLEAVEVFQARLGDIDLALLDAVMPRMDGIEALEKMRALRPSLRALFSTGYSGTAFGHGQSIPDDVDVIRKPYTLDELLRRVRAILDDAREPGRANPVSCRLDGQLSTGHGLNSGNRETGGSPTGRVDLTRSQRVHP